MKKIITLLLLLSSINAYAQEDNPWIIQTSTQAGSIVYTKKILKVVDKKKRIYDFWIKFENQPPKECKAPSNQYEMNICDNAKKINSGSQMNRTVLDCSIEKYKNVASIFYDYDGNVMSNTEIEGKFQSIVPDSIMDNLKNTICYPNK